MNIYFSGALKKHLMMYVFSFLLFFPMMVLSQITFEREIFLPQDARGKFITLLPDSTILVISEPLLPGNPGYYLTKTDLAGSVIWNKVCSSNVASNNIADGQFFQTSDHNLIHYGTRNLNGSTGSALVKLDTAGNLIWYKGFPRSHIGTSAVKETSDKGFILAMYIWDTLITSVYYDNLIVKTDSAGNVLWSKLFQKDSIPYDYRIIQTDDGGYLYTNGANISKLDSLGNIVRSSCFDSRQYMGLGFRDLIRINPNAYLNASGCHLNLIDSAGTVLWDKELFTLGPQYLAACRLTDTSFALMLNELLIWPGMTIEKIDTSGVTFQRTYYDIWNEIIGGTFTSLNDGSFLMAGSIKFDIWYPTNLFLMNTNTSGHTDCGTSDWISQHPTLSDSISPWNIANINFLLSTVTDTLESAPSTVTGFRIICSTFNNNQENGNAALDFHIFPNPSQGTFSIVTGDKIQDGELEIYDLLGNLVFLQSLPTPNNLIYKNLSPGMYFIKLTSGNQCDIEFLNIY